MSNFEVYSLKNGEIDKNKTITIWELTFWTTRISQQSKGKYVGFCKIEDRNQHSSHTSRKPDFENFQTEFLKNGPIDTNETITIRKSII